jgi:hypothetical protein
MREGNRKWALGTMVGLALATAAGCTARADIYPLPSGNDGTFTVQWSVGGRFNASQCAAYGADQMELVITDASGRRVATAYQPCEEMKMTVPLPPGSYVADARLLDVRGRPVSTTLNLQPFSIYRGTDTAADTDFPASSMLTVL